MKALNERPFGFLFFFHEPILYIESQTCTAKAILYTCLKLLDIPYADTDEKKERRLILRSEPYWVKSCRNLLLPVQPPDVSVTIATPLDEADQYVIANSFILINPPDKVPAYVGCRNLCRRIRLNRLRVNSGILVRHSRYTQLIAGGNAAGVGLSLRRVLALSVRPMKVGMAIAASMSDDGDGQRSVR